MMKNEKLAERLASILRRLNTGEKLNVVDLAHEFKVSIRTIQRDLNQRLYFLHWKERGESYSLDTSQLGHLCEADIKQFARFCSIQNLLPKIDREFYQEHLLQSIRIKGFQYEDISSRQADFALIHKAIESKNKIKFNYRKAEQETGKYYSLEPYSLLNKNGIWYVIGVDCAAQKQKTFCFTQMSEMRKLPETFEMNADFQAAIQKNDSISHGNQLAEIIVRVNAQVAPYFLRRPLLSNQETLHKTPNGDVLLQCKNVNEMEVVPIVQYWIPHVSIVSPIELQQKMEQRLRDYLNRDFQAA